MVYVLYIYICMSIYSMSVYTVHMYIHSSLYSMITEREFEKRTCHILRDRFRVVFVFVHVFSPKKATVCELHEFDIGERCPRFKTVPCTRRFPVSNLC